MGGPAPVEPIFHEGIRYEALHWGKPRDLGQNGGFIAAFDGDGAEELWVARVYRITYGDKSPQKYDRFITDLALSEDRTALIVTDERGGRYRFDLESHASTALNDEALPTGEPPRKGLMQRWFGD